MSTKIIRQNPYGLKSKDFIEYIENNDIITCPFGHSIQYTNKIIFDIFNFYGDSKHVDQKFTNELEENDLVVIPIEGKKKFILKKITNSNNHFKTIPLLLIKNIDGKVIKIVTATNYSDEDQNNVNYQAELLKITYKHCENLGTFNYNFPSLKLGINSYHQLHNKKTRNLLSISTNNQYVF